MLSKPTGSPNAGRRVSRLRPVGARTPTYEQASLLDDKHGPSLAVLAELAVKAGDVAKAKSISRRLKFVRDGNEPSARLAGRARRWFGRIAGRPWPPGALRIPMTCHSESNSARVRRGGHYRQRWRRCSPSSKQTVIRLQRSAAGDARSLQSARRPTRTGRRVQAETQHALSSIGEGLWSRNVADRRQDIRTRDRYKEPVETNWSAMGSRRRASSNHGFATTWPLKLFVGGKIGFPGARRPVAEEGEGWLLVVADEKLLGFQV